VEPLLVSLLILLLVVAIAVYIVQLLPLDARFKQIAYLIIGLLALLALLRTLGYAIP
jgi:hypothetical protein